MRDIFHEILSLSLSAAYLVPVVLVLRLALKKSTPLDNMLALGLGCFTFGDAVLFGK